MPHDPRFRACTRDAAFLLGCAKMAKLTGQLSIRFDMLPRKWSVWIGGQWLGEGNDADEAMANARAYFQNNFLTRHDEPR